jgi:hypothetical protein
VKSLAPLAIAYAIVGIGCAAATLADRRSSVRLLDAALVLAFWPLYGPFLLIARDERFSPLVDVRVLESRVAAAAAKLRDLEAVAARPDLARPSTVPRLEELRLATLRRLDLLHDRFTRELEEAAQLLSQFKTHAEVVRLVERADHQPEIEDLVALLEGLDEVLRE